jgi:propionate CoA-transferase
LFAIIRGDEAMVDAIPRSTLAPLEAGRSFSAEEAVRLIGDDDTIATGGFIGIGFPEDIAVAIEALHFSQDEQSVRAMSKRRNFKLINTAASTFE